MRGAQYVQVTDFGTVVLTAPEDGTKLRKDFMPDRRTKAGRAWWARQKQ